MFPILAGYIAMALADRPALMPGIVGGLLAKSGMENELSLQDVKEADVVLLAVSVAIEGRERFEEKEEEGKVYNVDPSVVIKSTGKVFDKLEEIK